MRRATLVYYTNFSPTLRRMAFIPLSDWALDFRNDFAVIYDRQTRALLHFLPASAQGVPPDFSLVNPLLQAPPRSRRALARAVTALAAGLSGPGVYIAIGAVAGDDGYQCGFDDAPICPHGQRA